MEPLVQLKKLFQGIEVPDVSIQGIVSHSKSITPGSLFISKKGSHLVEAEKAGAAAVLTPQSHPDLSIPQIIHQNVASIEPEIVNRYYQFPSQKLFTVGVTGTNGKTTTSWIMHHLFKKLGIQTGVIGTIEYRVGDKKYTPTHTTPDISTNIKLLSEMVKKRCQACVMEVSSHALDQERVKGIDFDLAIFTNLTSEHLDYHSNMESYLKAKQKLFLSLKSTSKSIVNADCPYSQKILKDCKAPKFSYSIEEKSDLQAEDVVLTPSGTYFRLNSTYNAFSPLVGRYNLSNTLAAISGVLAKGFALDEIISHLKSLLQIPGRLERVPNPSGFDVFVDYAHTDDALKNVLKTLCELKKGRIITVFGCGGDRDTTKRPRMAKIAEQYSDTVIITSDNPRSEDPAEIAHQIQKGFSPTFHPHTILDREEAIHKAIFDAKPGDIVLIAGKGHETKQIFASETIEFSDVEVASRALHQTKEQLV